MFHSEKQFTKDLQFYKFCIYGFLKNLRFYEPFLILFFLQQGFTFFQIGSLIAIREISRNILEIPAGIMADAMGRKRTLVWSFLFYIASFIIFYFGSGFTVFASAMFVYSLGDAYRTGTHKAMMFEYLKLKGWQDQKVYYYGHTRSYSQIGSAVSSLIAAAVVISWGDYRSIFIFTTLPYLLDLLLVASYPKALNGELYGMPHERIPHLFRRVFQDFINSFRKAKTLRAIGNLAIHTGYYQALKDYLQPVIQMLALSLPILLAWNDEQRVAILVGIVYFMIYLLTAYSARKSGRVASRSKYLAHPLNVSLVFGFGFGILSGFSYQMNWMIPAVILYIVIYMVENLRKPIGIAYVAEITDRNILATVLSAESQAQTLIAALLAPVIGLVADQFGIGYAILGVSMLMFLLMPVYWLKKQGKG